MGDGLTTCPQELLLVTETYWEPVCVTWHGINNDVDGDDDEANKFC